ncbi:ATP-dependent DNA helicase RecG [Caproiciproducens galactitolivorans]|uniref:ATP-dependent DNA helicase RecG n=1 Tax=Caproiciproducens galactitolivorans TaxID=642589 RepID=A0ABT4BP91_9FIRM|nr:ATP-dependent DNA helicase RecG [Caproiciproducens galactitolivorans]MCY1712665.1 ATP-dependent DNA helicase RecG [Caproiciproducens galactitolivorans]
MRSLFYKKIQELKGVGEKRARLFAKLGAPTVGALLRFYPRAYEDWSNPIPIQQAPLDVPCAIRGTVLERPSETRIRGGMTLYKVKITDGDSDMELTYFNNPYIPLMLKEGEEYLFYGKVKANFLKREMSAPQFCSASDCPAVHPIYPLTKGLSGRMIESAVKNAFALLPDAMQDPIPEDIRMQYGLCQLRYALENIHRPRSMEDLGIARKRLVFEELLVLQLGLLRLKGRSRTESRLRLPRDDSAEYFALLPFEPTGAQRRAVKEAVGDMMSGYPMNRLIQGDVGSGKTAVAAALCYCAVRSGMQAALMAPTEILARQHFATLSGLLKGVRTVLLTGSLTAAKKRAISESLQSGEIQLVIGTHAILSEGIAFQRLGLVITDEQHRFGVSQRAALASKGDDPHMLVMSATPIPRTLALMIYGDLDLSVLDEMPPGRQKVDTYAVTGDKRLRAFRFIKKQIDAGRQCYIICPMIEEGPNDMASVNEYAVKTRKEWLPGCKIGVLHGKMKPKEKEAVMTDFSEGRISVLISTTVVEVGMDVPNATVMMIENAERYGLSQLHQLRGRVGRGTDKSICILISDAQNEDTVARLKTMCQTNDGFRIAEQDLKLRGPGDFFGHRQHGLPELKIADMTQDMNVLKQAQAVAREILRTDADLKAPSHRGLRAEVRQLFENKTD